MHSDPAYFGAAIYVVFAKAMAIAALLRVIWVAAALTFHLFVTVISA
jgi:hypothetical protein